MLWRFSSTCNNVYIGSDMLSELVEIIGKSIPGALKHDNTRE